MEVVEAYSDDQAAEAYSDDQAAGPYSGNQVSGDQASGASFSLVVQGVLRSQYPTWEH